MTVDIWATVKGEEEEEDDDEGILERGQLNKMWINDLCFVVKKLNFMVEKNYSL